MVLFCLLSSCCAYRVWCVERERAWVFKCLFGDVLLLRCAERVLSGRVYLCVHVLTTFIFCAHFLRPHPPFPCSFCFCVFVFIVRLCLLFSHSRVFLCIYMECATLCVLCWQRERREKEESETETRHAAGVTCVTRTKMRENVGGCVSRYTRSCTASSSPPARTHTHTHTLHTHPMPTRPPPKQHRQPLSPLIARLAVVMLLLL